MPLSTLLARKKTIQNNIRTYSIKNYVKRKEIVSSLLLFYIRSFSLLINNASFFPLFGLPETLQGKILKTNMSLKAGNIMKIIMLKIADFTVTSSRNQRRLAHGSFLMGPKRGGWS